MPVGVVSGVRLAVGSVHKTSKSTPLILSSTNKMVQVNMRDEPVMKEDEDDTITEEGARTTREMRHMQYNIIRASI